MTVICPKCTGEFELYETLFFDSFYKCPLCGEFIEIDMEEKK